MRRLIINADDFGLTPGVNRAIVEGHRRGIVTSATLMATGAAFADAVQLAHATPTLAVGCHVVLIADRPLGLQPGTLAQKDGLFYSAFGAFALAALRGRIRGDDIEREVIAQIRKLHHAGIEVSHVDTHKHAHMVPPVLDALLRAARNCGVRAIRNPFVPARPLALGLVAGRPRLWKRFGQVKVLRQWKTNFVDRVHEAGFATTDGSFGVLETGELDDELFAAAMAAMPDGTWEFVCHPGYNDIDLDRVTTRLRASRQHELEVLTGATARAALEARDIERISYRNLTAKS